jgi:PKD repeat protein
LKTKKQNINLRKLFRKKLENAEVTPDAEIRSILMKRVARKEFMYFNPAKLNIYYLGGILITGIITAVLLLSGSGNSLNLNSSDTSGKLNKTDTISHLQILQENPVKIDSQNSNKTNIKSLKISGSSKLPLKPLSSVKESVELHIDTTPIPTIIRNSFSNSILIPKVITDDKKLQSRFKKEISFIYVSETSGCAPLKVKFHNVSTSYDSCRWTFGDGGYSDKTDPEWIFDVEGEYKVILKVFTPGGKFLTSSVLVTVHPRPKAHFEITPDKANLPDDEIRFMNYSTNAVRSLWDFGDGTTSDLFEPRHVYTKFGKYNVRLVVFSEWGCSDSLTVLNAFSGSEYYIEFPNAFIPNIQGPTGGLYSLKSDESAQVFHPSFSGVSDYQLKIFSKLGIQIFESNDINLGWDGYNNGQLSEPGVYIWKVRGKFRNGEPYIKMGDVTLLKN